MMWQQVYQDFDSFIHENQKTYESFLSQFDAETQEGVKLELVRLIYSRKEVAALDPQIVRFAQENGRAQVLAPHGLKFCGEYCDLFLRFALAEQGQISLA